MRLAPLKNVTNIRTWAAPCVLGAQSCPIRTEYLGAHAIYGDEVNERHRHRYEVNNHYVEQLKAAGLVSFGTHAYRSLCVK